MLPGLRTLFSTETFMARGHSYLWTPALVVMELATNALIALAAPRSRWRCARGGARGRAFDRRRSAYAAARGVRARAGGAHALDVWVIWTPLYGVDVVVRAAAAVAAVAAAIVAAPRCCGAEADDGDRRIRPRSTGSGWRIWSAAAR